MENEKIVEVKVCKQCNSSFDITDKDLEFYNKISPTFNGEKFQIPTPTLCPECRKQRRLIFRNERSLYKRKCDATGKDIVSIFSPDKKFKIYEQDYWWSDSWNPLDYGKNFNFSRSFFEQFAELIEKVPRPAVLNGYNENSYYCNHAGKQKNCYFSIDGLENEKCYYTNNIYYSNNCIDSSTVMNSELISNSLNIKKSFNCHDCLILEDCSNCYLCQDMINSNYCLGCTNIVNSNYYVLNKKVTREEFENTLENYKKDYIFRKEFIKKFDSLNSIIPKKNLHNVNVSNSLGDYLMGTDNVKYSYNCQNSKNLKYCTSVYDGNDCYDYDVWGDKTSLVYETHCTGGMGTGTSGANNILFSNIIWGGSDIYYSDLLLNNSKNCFGCVGLKNNEEYCILNKKYSKQEYEELVPKIIEHMQKTGEWGEFFSYNISHYGYNETIAQEYYPLTKEEALKQGFKWSDYQIPFPKVEKIIPADKLPDDISDIPDDILNWAIECEVTKKPFRIIAQELEFYRKHNLPIPRRHPDQRHLDRMALRNPRKLYDRKCDKCGIDMKTTYAPDRKEIVYCEECYNKEVY